MRGERNNRMVKDPVGTEGVEKLLPVALQVRIGPGQSNVQGRFCVAAANSFTSKLSSRTANYI